MEGQLIILENVNQKYIKPIKQIFTAQCFIEQFTPD